MSEVATRSQAELRCRVPGCNSRLDADEDDDLVLQVCNFCIKRPEGRRLLAAAAAKPANTSLPERAQVFGPAELSLIRRLRGLMPARQLLDILNERLLADRGAGTAPYTLPQLEAEIGASPLQQSGTGDWASLRKLLAKAARDGVLARISEQVIDDFAVVWSLNSKQVVALKDIVLAAREDLQ